jgi:hypothetical protein
MKSIGSLLLGALLTLSIATAVSACGSDAPSTTEDRRGPVPVGNVKPQPGGSQCGGCIMRAAELAPVADVDASAE